MQMTEDDSLPLYTCRAYTGLALCYVHSGAQQAECKPLSICSQTVPGPGHTRASRTTPYCYLISRTHWKTVWKYPDRRVLWDSSAKSRFWPLSASQFAAKVHPSNSHRTHSSTFVSPFSSSCSLTGHCCSNRCRALASPIVFVVRPGTCRSFDLLVQSTVPAKEGT